MLQRKVKKETNMVNLSTQIIPCIYNYICLKKPAGKQHMVNGSRFHVISYIFIPPAASPRSKKPKGEGHSKHTPCLSGTAFRLKHILERKFEKQEVPSLLQIESYLVASSYNLDSVGFTRNHHHIAPPLFFVMFIS